MKTSPLSLVRRLRSCVVLLIVFATNGKAQRSLPAAYTDAHKINYTRTWDVLKPRTDPSVIQADNDLQTAKMITAYTDGLGRTIQTVIKQGSYPTNDIAADLVDATIYDEFGREQYKYLPFRTNAAGENTSISDGLFKVNPFQQQEEFYKNTNLASPIAGQQESFFYSRIKFESSPLHRLLGTFAPGNNWVGQEGTDAFSCVTWSDIPNVIQVSCEPNDHSKKIQYWSNTDLDAVRIWNVGERTDGSLSSYTSTATYNKGELYKISTLDEHNKQTIEFRDKSDKLVLKKIQLTADRDPGRGSDHAGWLCTYYMYDDLENLRCMIQPRGVELISSTWQLSDASILEEQCFRYEYDQRNRMIIKKVPGAGAIFMVYDARDRLVLTQDANLRDAHPQQWMYTQYDALNRPVSAGLWNNSDKHSTHALAAKTSIIYPDLNGQEIELLTETFYDNYDWLVSASLPASYKDRNTGLDSYFTAPDNMVFPYPQPVRQSFATTGMVTGTKAKVLGTSQFIYNLFYYDDKGRPLQNFTLNITGARTIHTNQYSFSGQLLVETDYIEKYGTEYHQLCEITNNEYDLLGRLVSIKKNPFAFVNGKWEGGIGKEIVRNEYDALGQLRKKKLAPAYNNGAGLEEITYDFNIRGWMLGANREFAKDMNDKNYFGFDLGYDRSQNGIINDQTYKSAQYNGNIGGTVWKSKGDGEKRKYDFTYDAANRLLSADFTQYAGNVFDKSANVDFSVSGMTYDANGNIQAMKQQAFKVSGSECIDQLTYAYYPNSNKLKAVADDNNDVQTGLDDFRQSLLYTHNSGHKTSASIGSFTDYEYDGNGNLVKDLNKDIGNSLANGVTYNHLDLPSVITVSGKGTITYTYDAAGNKLKKLVQETGKPDRITLYIGDAVYENDTLQFVAQEEGRIRFRTTDNSFQFDYFLKDHLGNIRMILTEEKQTDIYPFATMETADATAEEMYYRNINKTSTTRPPAYLDATTDLNERVSRVKANGSKAAPAILLKVMAGDQFDIHATSFWEAGLSPGVNAPVKGILTAIRNNLPDFRTGKIASRKPGFSIADPTIVDLISNDQANQYELPKAYLNWMLLDERFKAVPNASGTEQVGNAGSVKTHDKRGTPVDKNGYLYVYVSNETEDINVFFDNLQVVHTRGPVLEETHYYPFGLTMAGISSKALAFGGAGNNYKFQGQEFATKEFSDGTGLDMYEFKWRMHDPQIGRFWQADPLAHDYRYNSIYAFSENRVTSGVELEGLEYVSIHHISNGGRIVQNHYKSTDAEINKMNGTTSGFYNSASYGSQGKGVVHYYYNTRGEIYDTRWDQQQAGGNSNLAYHGLYSGPGSITRDGGGNSTNYDFSFQPIDWADAIAKRHDMDYVAATASGDTYAGFLEDIRTVQADKDMIQRIKDYGNIFISVTGIETPYRKSWSGEMAAAMKGQSLVISALADYKQWKIDNHYRNSDTYDKLRDKYKKHNQVVARIIDLIVER